MDPQAITASLAPNCVYCGYDLTGLRDESVCPECGQPIWSAAATYELDNLAKKVQITGLVCIFSFFSCLGPIAALLAIPTFVLAHRFKLQLADGVRASPTARSAVEVGIRCAAITVLLAILFIVVVTLKVVLRG